MAKILARFIITVMAESLKGGEVQLMLKSKDVGEPVPGGDLETVATEVKNKPVITTRHEKPPGTEETEALPEDPTVADDLKIEEVNVIEQTAAQIKLEEEFWKITPRFVKKADIENYITAVIKVTNEKGGKPVDRSYVMLHATKQPDRFVKGFKVFKSGGEAGKKAEGEKPPKTAKKKEPPKAPPLKDDLKKVKGKGKAKRKSVSLGEALQSKKAFEGFDDQMLVLQQLMEQAKYDKGDLEKPLDKFDLDEKVMLFEYLQDLLKVKKRAPLNKKKSKSDEAVDCGNGDTMVRSYCDNVCSKNTKCPAREALLETERAL